jgi:uncharacterized protein YebE (UPF0316 family)
MILNVLLYNDSDFFTWIILPLLIFLSRIADQSIGSMRLIFLSKGYKFIAPMLGFFEVIIWLIAVSQIMKHLDNVLCYIAYGAGFAMGNFIGMTLEERISIGTVLVRTIPNLNTEELIEALRIHNFGLTTVDANGSRGEVKIFISIINRKDLKEYISIINKINPNAFYTIEDVKTINQGIVRNNSRNSILGTIGKSFRISK